MINYSYYFKGMGIEMNIRKSIPFWSKIYNLKVNVFILAMCIFLASDMWKFNLFYSVLVGTCIAILVLYLRKIFFTKINII